MFARTACLPRTASAVSGKARLVTRGIMVVVRASATALTIREPCGAGYWDPLYWRTCAFTATAKRR